MGFYKTGEEFAYAYRPDIDPIKMVASYGFVAEYDNPFAVITLRIVNLFGLFSPLQRTFCVKV